jgi:SAM-dependent methyltransferase
MITDKNSQLVREGYNQIARTYLTERKKLKTNKYVSALIKLLPKESLVLDVGCGAGVPVDDLILKSGHGIVGIDISSEQIRLARSMCKGGDYMVRDINELVPLEYQAQAVICLYTMFHVARVKHAEVLSIFASYLPKGGHLLVSFGDRNFEGKHILYGAPMWSSQWGEEKNRSMVKRAGFEIITEELNTSGSERHQVILAVKK